MSGRTLVAPSLSILAAATFLFLTVVLAVSPPLDPATSTQSFASRSFAAAPVRRFLAQVFESKSPIIVPAPTAFQLEQQMSYGDLTRRWNPFIAEASKRFSVPAAWIRAVMQLESGGRTLLGENQPIVSRAGAMGLMQLMPSTYADMRKAYGLGANPYDPHDNIMAGAAYIRVLRAKYTYPILFEAYNDGPGHLEERMKNGGLLPAETQMYVANITRKLEGRGAIVRGEMAKFTRPNGEPVWVNVAAATRVRTPAPGEFADGVKSVIMVGRTQQGVRESVAAVTRSLRERGAAV